MTTDRQTVIAPVELPTCPQGPHTHSLAETCGRRYASTNEAAAYLGVSDRTIRLMIADGRLTAYRGLGPRMLRIDLNDIDEKMRG